MTVDIGTAGIAREGGGMAVETRHPVPHPAPPRRLVDDRDPGLAGYTRMRGVAPLALVFGAVAALLAYAGSWIPSFWGDETASIMSAERPLPSLFRMLQSIDAVHGVYYVFLHGWIDLFGASPASVRLPSSLAIGVATAGIVALVARLGDRRIAVIAGIVFLALPRTSWLGTETRSYAIGVAMAVWVTVLLVVLVDRGITSATLWIAYGVALAACVWLFLYLALIIPVHAVVVLLGRTRRMLWWRFGAAVVLGVVLALPLVHRALGQREQIAFLAKRDYLTARNFFVVQWFSYPLFAIVAWLIVATLVVTSVAAVVRRMRLRTNLDTQAIRIPGRRRPFDIALGHRLVAAAHLPTSAAPGRDRARSALIILSVAWLSLPSLILVAGNEITPTYNLRYLAWLTPAIAILMAVSIDRVARLIAIRVPRHRARATLYTVLAATTALIVGLSLPPYLGERMPYSKDGGSDLSQIAQVVGEHARPGDGVLFDEGVRPSHRLRTALHVYPADFRGLVDVRLASPYQDNAGLWDTTVPFSDLASRVAPLEGKLFYVRYDGPKPVLAVDTLGTLAGLGWQVDHTYRLHRDLVYELSRTSAAAG